jgi:hypothetical protein
MHYNKNKSWLLLLLMITLNSTTLSAQARTNELVGQIMNTLDSAYKYFETNIKRQTLFSQQFDSLFNLLASEQQVSPLLINNETNAGNKLIKIAQYKAAKPQLFTEVKEKYIIGIDNKQKRSPASPPLTAQFIAEPYRLVWEYYLLQPPAAGMAELYDGRISEAIAGINNPNSIQAIEMTYKNSTKSLKPPDYAIINKQKLLLITIGKMPSDAAAVGLAKLINIPIIPADSSHKINWNPKLFAKEMLAGKQNLANESTWKKVLNKAGKNKLLDANTKKTLKDIKQ